MNLRGVIATLGLCAPILLVACGPENVNPALSEGETGAGDEGGDPRTPPRDLKTIDASSCVVHPDSAGQFELTPESLSLNSTGSAGRVLCPILRDRPQGDDAWSVSVTALDSHGQDNVSCSAIARSLEGEIIAESPIISTTGSGGAQTLLLEVPNSEPSAYHYVDCSVPGVDELGDRSGLASFTISEVKIDETTNGKSHPGLLARSNDVLLSGSVVIDELGLAEFYIPETEGLTVISLPLVRDNPDELPERLRVHYFLDGGFLFCSVSIFDDAGVRLELPGDVALEQPFGTIEIPIPAAPISDGPHVLECIGSGPAAILAYELEEP